MKFNLKKVVNNLNGRRIQNWILAFSPNTVLNKKGKTITLFDIIQERIVQEWHIENSEPYWIYNDIKRCFFYTDYSYKVHQLFLDAPNQNEIVCNGLAVFAWNETGDILVYNKPQKSVLLWNIHARKFTFDLSKLHDFGFCLHVDDQKSVWSKKVKNTLFNKLDYAILCVYDKVSDTRIWEYDVRKTGIWRDVYTNSREDYEILNVIGIHKNILWCDLKAGALLGLSIVTGELIYFFKMPTVDVPYFSEKAYHTLYDSLQTIYDSASNKLIGVKWWHYYEIDLNKAEPTLELQLFKAECLKWNTTVSHSERRCMDATHLYFADATNAKLVALNRTTLKIDWCYPFTGKEANQVGTLMSVEINGVKLYVLDHLGNLFIFEREIKENLKVRV